MRNTVWAAVLMASAAMFVADGSLGAAAARDGASAYAQSSQNTGQRRVRVRRSPTQVRVYRLPSNYLGPNAVRQCTARLVQDHRPSGTVIVPRMHCWWERG